MRAPAIVVDAGPVNSAGIFWRGGDLYWLYPQQLGRELAVVGGFRFLPELVR